MAHLPTIKGGKVSAPSLTLFQKEYFQGLAVIPVFKVPLPQRINQLVWVEYKWKSLKRMQRGILRQGSQGEYYVESDTADNNMRGIQAMCAGFRSLALKHFYSILSPSYW
jgi:hypothetical protein